MSRCIEFRVWDVRKQAYTQRCNDKLVFCTSAGSGNLGKYGPIVANLYDATTQCDEQVPVYYDGYQLVLEQFTGLLDADNRDIYEGDIISFSTNGHPHGPESDDVKGGVVWWDIEEAAFAFGRWTHPHCDEPFDYGYAPCQIRWSTVRVVGNIHEHSHLITP